MRSGGPGLGTFTLVHVGRLLVLEGPDDRDPTGQAGRIDGREDADQDPEAEGQGYRSPRRIEDEPEATARPGNEQGADDQPDGDTDDRPDDSQDPGLDDHHAPHLAAGHARRTKHADLTNALEDAHGERVDHTQAGYQNRNQSQRIEQLEDAIQSIAHRPRDSIEVVRHEGIRGGHLVERRPGGRFLAGHIPDGVEVGPGDPELRQRIGPADEDRLLALGRYRMGHDAADAEWRGREADRELHGVAHFDASLIGE